MAENSFRMPRHPFLLNMLAKYLTLDIALLPCEHCGYVAYIQDYWGRGDVLQFDTFCVNCHTKTHGRVWGPVPMNWRRGYNREELMTYGAPADSKTWVGLRPSYQAVLAHLEWSRPIFLDPRGEYGQPDL